MYDVQTHSSKNAFLGQTIGRLPFRCFTASINFMLCILVRNQRTAVADLDIPQ